MLLKEQHKILVKGIEDLTLENVMFHVDINRKFDVYGLPLINFHKRLFENKLDNLYEYNHFMYDFKTMLSEKVDLSNFSNSNKNIIKNCKDIPSKIYEFVSNGYMYSPSHIYESNGTLKIDWNKFSLNNHIRFIRESTSFLAIHLNEGQIMQGFWDGSPHVIKENKNLITEGSALGCDKKSYNVARKVFNEAKKEVSQILKDGGFIVENVYDAGSLRRKKSVVGDIDIIVNVLGHKDVGLIERHPLEERKFASQYRWLFGNEIKNNITSEVSKSYKNITQFIKNDMQCDVFLCTPTSLPTRRLYWTGSAGHNVKMMYEGFKNDIVFSFDYIFDKNRNKFLVAKDEKQIFEIFNIDYIEPEYRV